MIAAGVWMVVHVRGWAGEDAVLLSLGGGGLWGGFMGLPLGALYASGAAGFGLLILAAVWGVRRAACPPAALPSVVTGWLLFFTYAALV